MSFFKDTLEKDPFNEFYQAFTTSAPSQLALREHQLSVNAPSHYLSVAKSHLRTEDGQDTRGDSDLPSHLERIQSLQQVDGSWVWTQEFRRIFHDQAPDPEVGISSWRWATGCAVIHLRRYPDHFDLLYETCQKGMAHLDPGLMSLIQQRLPWPFPGDSRPMQQEEETGARAGARAEVRAGAEEDREEQELTKDYDRLKKSKQRQMQSVIQKQFDQERNDWKGLQELWKPLSSMAEQEQEPEKTKVSQSSSPCFSLPRLKAKPSTRPTGQRKDDDDDPQEFEIVQAILYYEELRDKVRPLQESCGKKYKSARRYADRMEIFRPLTMLFREIVEATVTLIELVVGREDPEIDFIWNGTNILHELPRAWDHLAQDLNLVHWYGPSFPFVLNPFFRFLNLPSRVPTPRSAYKKVITSGQAVRLELSPLLEAEREADLVAYTAAERVIDRGAHWWPESKYSPEMKSRIRTAEKVLLRL